MHAASVHQTESVLLSILVQLIVMIGSARLMNSVFRRLNQPGVIGEIVAGLLLGPSLFGHFFPQVSTAIFGLKSAQPITIISQIGLILLMFQIGSDFEFGHLGSKRNLRAAFSIAAVSILAPLGVGLGFGVVSASHLAPGLNPTVYALFCAVAFAITAVPILGRILRQYGLTRDEIGVIAISAAAVNDVVGWVLLAIVSAFASAQLSPQGIGVQIAGLAGLGLGAWWLLRPLTDRLVRTFPVRDGEVAPNLMAIIFALVFALAVCTNALGVFSIFGGFLAGLLFHRHSDFVEAWRKQVGQMVLVFFLPVFFTYTGLRTNVLGLTTAENWLWLAVILVGAIAAKIGPVYLTARLNGFAPKPSAMLGVLMNTRALMELIVLNIGYDLGFMPQSVFTMLVIMAVVTTIMAGPLLKRLLVAMNHPTPVGIEA